MFLLGGSAWACFASSLTDQRAAGGDAVIIFCYALLQFPQRLLMLAGGDRAEPLVRELLEKCSVMTNFSEWFARGLIDTSQVVFYLGGIGCFLFLATVSLSSRRVA
jgi:hypothetical protein